MNLEPRYLVLKISDVMSSLSPSEREVLARITQKVETSRQQQGKAPFKAIVIEQDWPEYGPARAALEARINSEQGATHDG